MVLSLLPSLFRLKSEVRLRPDMPQSLLDVRRADWELAVSAEEVLVFSIVVQALMLQCLKLDRPSDTLSFFHFNDQMINLSLVCHIIIN